MNSISSRVKEATNVSSRHLSLLRLRNPTISVRCSRSNTNNISIRLHSSFPCMFSPLVSHPFPFLDLSTQKEETVSYNYYSVPVFSFLARLAPQASYQTCIDELFRIRFPRTRSDPESLLSPDRGTVY